ncbi:MAG TPA: ATP-binding protein [Rhizomicrobium sp.]|jgi:signal transduction histidine kinase|nr:ATP-binding protein [Rhizomicrobium sp.]
MMASLARKEGWSLPVVAALIAAAVLLSAGVLMAFYEEQLYSAQQLKDVREEAQILAASVTAAIDFDDAGAVSEHLGALKVNPELQAGGVYDKAGRLMASFVQGNAVLPRGPLPEGAAYAGDHVDIVVPAIEQGARVGTVFLRASTEPEQRRLARYAGVILLVTMGALVILVLSLSQAALTGRARQLSAVNLQLHREMEERRKTEEALRQSSKMEAVGQLSGGIAHDFNNLIMIAKGNLRLLRKRLGPNAAQSANYIVSADEALDRAAALTQRILAFSRRQPLSPMPVRLSELVEGMGELIRHSVGEKVEIETRLPAIWWTRCDINQMENVVLNLAINARDAMPEGGRLVIETQDIIVKEAPPEMEDPVSDFIPGAYVALKVRDTGEGMSEAVRRRAVDPFFTTKPLGKGTGLGLSMTFGFVRQSNGYLTIESRPGAGTTISLYMPRYQEGTA